MSTNFQDKYAKCPFFKNFEQKNIKCESEICESDIHMFRNCQKAKEYFVFYCCRDYENCKHAKNLEKMYEKRFT